MIKQPRIVSRSKVICGAHAKSTGKPCGKYPMRGKSRCERHGGKTPKKKRPPESVSEIPNVDAP